jgi:glycerate kinase
MQRLTIATDSFKGSLTSREVAEAFAEGWHEVFPRCDIRKVCIADGGEGTLETLVEGMGGSYVEVEVHDPLHRPTKARYGIIDAGRTAIIEMASASGLTLLKEEERNPMETSTFGTGEMVADALKRGCRKVLLGIGGSATNDCGVGMFRALGYRFLDANSNELEGGGNVLHKIAEIDDSQRLRALDECEFIVACDVTNPLYGEQGAARIFAPQKGADRKMVEALDKGLRNFACAVERFNGCSIGEMEGAGAAGGLGGGLYALLGARLERGVDMVLEALEFDQIVADSDLVITGEGRLDRQTLMGKAPSGVLAVAQRHNIPTIAIGGAVEWCDELRQSGFSAIECITPEGQSITKAMTPAIAKDNVRRTAKRIAESYL